MRLIQTVNSNETVNLIKSKESVEFKIGNAAKIIDILRSKMYSNPIQTLVQEYLCNARDAMREVKGDASQITVVLPSEDKLVLSIKDKGPGISKDRMLNTFVQYGNSTKEGSNEQTGGFGLGSKLAWAYTDNFNIITVVDGVEYQYLAHIGKNKNGTLELISETKTKDANGTEIRIPVKAEDVHAFEDATTRAVFLWPEKPSIVNATASSLENLAPIALAKNIEVYGASDIKAVLGLGDHKYSGMLIVAIDKVPYILSETFVNENACLEQVSDLLTDNAALVFHVGNGVVEVSASRESISENERTLKAIQSSAKSALQLIKRHFNDKIEASKDLKAFIANFTLMGNYFNYSSAEKTLKGEKFQLSESGWRDKDLDLTSPKIEKLMITSVDTSRRRRNRERTSIPVNRRLYLVDEDLSQAKQTAKINQVGHMGTYVVIEKGENTFEYLNSLAQSINVTKISSIELPKVERKQAERAPEGMIKVQMLVKGDYHSRKSTRDMVIDLASNDQRWVYIDNSLDVKVVDFASLREFLKEFGYQVCLMGKTAMKAVESNSKFVALETFLKSPKEVITAKQYDSLVKLIGSHCLQHSANELYFLVEDKGLLSQVADKTLRDGLKTCSEYKESLYGYELVSGDFLISHFVKAEKTLAELDKLSKSLPKHIKDNYPLLPCIGSVSHSSYGESESQRKNRKQAEKQHDLHVIHYLNGAYKA